MYVHIYTYSYNQGKPVDIGGYYRPDHAKTSKAMCVSETLVQILKA